MSLIWKEYMLDSGETPFVNGTLEGTPVEEKSTLCCSIASTVLPSGLSSLLSLYTFLVWLLDSSHLSLLVSSNTTGSHAGLSSWQDTVLSTLRLLRLKMGLTRSSSSIWWTGADSRGKVIPSGATVFLSSVFGEKSKFGDETDHQFQRDGHNPHTALGDWQTLLDYEFLQERLSFGAEFLVSNASSKDETEYQFERENHNYHMALSDWQTFPDYEVIGWLTNDVHQIDQLTMLCWMGAADASLLSLHTSCGS